jgi:hypothetical protein
LQVRKNLAPSTVCFCYCLFCPVCALAPTASTLFSQTRENLNRLRAPIPFPTFFASCRGRITASLIISLRRGGNFGSDFRINKAIRHLPPSFLPLRLPACLPARPPARRVCQRSMMITYSHGGRSHFLCIA